MNRDIGIYIEDIFLAIEVKHIPEDVRQKYPEVSWRPAAAMRDFLIHEYPEVDVEALWSTLKQDLPAFKLSLLKIKKDNV